ncbi:MAG: type I restriction endonuclease subunit R [Kiritimatiellae bacterium]|nr:type I restriction endonuclease subunit R [Kiritimatiellia bacterium]
MAKILTEDDIEKALVKFLTGAGWGYSEINAMTAVREKLSDGTGRDDKSQCVLPAILRESLKALNPEIPEAKLEEVASELSEYRGADGVNMTVNRELYERIRNGVPVQFVKDGEEKSETVRLVNFDEPYKNDFRAVRQMWIRGVNDAWRRPDVLIFVNGLPLVFIELKNADRKVENAFNDNLANYKKDIPNLFAFNQVCVLSNAGETRVGAFASPWEHFFEWLRLDEKGERADRETLRKNVTDYAGCSLELLAKGLLDPQRLIDYVENFVLFDGLEAKVNKILAKNHQYLGVNAAMASLANRKTLKGKLGIFFHTQGSGKSYSMVFLARKAIRKLRGNFSFLVVTDRENLDGQIAKTFVRCGVVKAEDEARPKNAEKLREALSDNKLFTFTLIQKFRYDPGREYPVLSTRDDIIVMVDEAHRTQYKDLAANMRKGLPNANYLAFTGTPLGKTGEWFGGTISEYNFADAIADGSTCPIYYRNMAPTVDFCKNMMDSDVEAIGDEEELSLDEREKLERRFAAEIEVLTRDERITDNAKKIVEHFVTREWRGKAMVVAVDRYTAVKYHNAVNKYWPEFRKELNVRRIHAATAEERDRWQKAIDYMDKVERAVVISGDANEEQQFAKKGIPGIREIRERIDKIDSEGADIEDNFKDPNHPLSLVFVCAMWLTGTDIPCMSTMYLDKPMKGHTLMQTIARVNRVFPGKNHGLIVDFVNIFKYVEKALGIYVKPGAGITMPVKPIDDLIESLNKGVEDTKAFLGTIGIDLGKVSNLPKNQSFDKVEAFNDFLDRILSKDDWRNRFFIYTNKVDAVWTASKPEVFDFLGRVSKYLSPVLYLRKMMDARADSSRLEKAIARLAAELDSRVTIKVSGVQNGEGREIDLAKIDVTKIDEKLKQTNYPNLMIDDLRKVVEDELAKLLGKNKTRTVFSERYQKIVDEYNAGSVESEEAFKRLMELLDRMKEEEKRAEREGLTEQQLEIFDLLCSGRKLTKAQELAAKLAAKELVEKIEANVDAAFPPDWFKYQARKLQVRDFISETCADRLDGQFDKTMFDDGMRRIYRLFLDRALNNEPILHVA